MAGLWLLGQVMTDAYRDTAFSDWSRGDARILFLVLNLVVLTMLLSKNLRRQIIFIAGYGVGTFIGAFAQPNELMSVDMFKFGYAPGMIVLGVLISCYFHYRRRNVITGSILIALVVINLLGNFRSAVLLLMITIALSLPLVPERIGRLRLLPHRGTNLRVIVIIGFALAFSFTAAELVQFATNAGLLSSTATEKNRGQLDTNTIGGLLIGGRPEILVSARAVWDSPILGHGSWARSFKYAEMLHDIELRYGFQPDSLETIEYEGTPYIPAHSHIMGAWVDAGILGAAFWIYIMWLVSKALIYTARLQPPLAPYYFWLFSASIWGFCFSPFGNINRSLDAFVIVLAIDTIELVSYRRSFLDQMRRPRWRRMPAKRDFTPLSMR